MKSLLKLEVVLFTNSGIGISLISASFSAVNLTKEGNANYNDSSINYVVRIIGKRQREISVLLPFTVSYEVATNYFDLTLSGEPISGDFTVTIENNDVSSTKQSANIFRIGYGVPYEEGFNLTVTKGARNNFREQQNTFTFFVPMDLLYLTQKHTPSFLVKDANINLHDLIPFYSKNDFNGDGINVYSFLRAEPVINASVLYNLGWYTIRELKEAGYQIRIRLR